MAHYLVSAVPRTYRLDELRVRLTRDEFRELQPFGRALTKSLRDARDSRGRSRGVGGRGLLPPSACRGARRCIGRLFQ
jgi:hypothetical protein